MSRAERRPVVSRLLSWTSPVVLAVGVLVVAELLLRAFDVGGALEHDPFAGFSDLVSTFEAGRRADGTRVLRTARPPRFNAPQEFLAEKPADGFRVFVIGGSSAAGVPYSYDLAFSGWLQRRLQASLPDRRVEVVNAARSAYASRRLLAVTREIARYEPDLLIVYSGHNEWGEARYFRHLIDVDPRIFQLRVWLASSRLYAVTSRALGTSDSGKVEPVRFDDFANTMQMFGVANQRQAGNAPSPSEIHYREAHYRHNLEQMIREMRSAGARVMLLTLSQNFSDWPPGVSYHRPDLSDVELAAWNERFAQGHRRAPGDCEGALAEWREASAIDAGYARLHYDMAGCLRALGRLEEAQRAYLRASDLDGIPHGAPTRYNEILRELAEDHGSLFVDVAAIFAEESGDGLIGDDLFIDFAHPNLRAQQRIAKAIADALRAQSLPVAGDAWIDAYEDPDVDRIRAEQPDLRKREHLARAVACLLGRRVDCIVAEAEAALVLDPDEQAAKDMLRTARQLDISEPPAAAAPGTPR